MITEGYFAQKNNYPETDWLICISRMWPWFIKRDQTMSHFPSLAPSPNLLGDYKTEGLEWEDYESRYRREIEESEQARRDIAWIGIKDCQGETVRLMCWEKAEDKQCHRFLLLDIISELS